MRCRLSVECWAGDQVPFTDADDGTHQYIKFLTRYFRSVPEAEEAAQAIKLAHQRVGIRCAVVRQTIRGARRYV